MSRKLGDKGEDLALAYLKKHGFKCLARNYYCRFGEIDIIGLINKILIFVEVKKRNSATFGEAAEMVGVAKQTKIIKTAQFFLNENRKYQVYVCRFDVIAITGDDINWIEAAF
ncbi:MAG: YraN family protein [Francisellaceae bacterium]